MQQPEETITVPVRAGHRFGDPEQPTEVLAVPGEAFFQSRDALKLARPFLLEQRARSQRHPIAGVGIPPIRRAALWPTRLPPYHSAVSAPTHSDRRKRRLVDGDRAHSEATTSVGARELRCRADYVVVDENSQAQDLRHLRGLPPGKRRRRAGQPATHSPDAFLAPRSKAPRSGESSLPKVRATGRSTLTAAFA
jgi:hypothetical protein